MVIDILLTNGKKIYLDKDIQIDWVQENMFFEEDVKLRGKYSYPFSIDRSANSDALDFPDVISSAGEINKKSCIVMVSGIQFYKGQLNILDWTDEKINVAITRDTDEVNTNKYIDEVPMPSYSLISSASNRNADKEKFYPEVDYAHPQFYQYDEATVEKYGSDTKGEYNLIANWRNGNSETANGDEVTVPMFYFLSVLREVFADLKLAIKTKLFSDTFFNRLLIYNPITTVVDTPNCLKIETFTTYDGKGYVRMRDKLSCFAVPAGSILSMKVVEYNDFGIVTSSVLSVVFNSTDVSSISNLMDKIKNEIVTFIPNMSFVSSNYTADRPTFTIAITNSNEFVIYPIGMPDPDVTTRVDRGIFQLPIWFDDNRNYQSSILMKNHIPHITISSFLNAIKTNFNLAICLDELNGVVRIYRRADIVKNENKKDMTQFLLDINEGMPNKPLNYKFVFNHDSDNDTLTLTLQSIATNIEASAGDAVELKSDAGTLATENLRNSNSGFITMPKVNQEFGDYTNIVSYGLRFLYLQGYVSDDNGKKVVSANNDGLLPNQIYQYQYEDWYSIIKRMKKAPVIYMDFGLDQLKSMEPDAWKVLNNDFLWKRITTTIHNTNGIQPSKVEGYKL